MSFNQQCKDIQESFLSNISDGNNDNDEYLQHSVDAIKQFLTAVKGTAELSPEATKIWRKIISQTLVIILSVDHLPNEASLKTFHSKILPFTTNPYYRILHEVDDLQDLLQLAKEGPWISLSYKLILNGKKCNHHEVRKLIKHESIQVVTHRIKAILPDSKIAYNYGKHVITISKFKHITEIQRLVQTAAVKCLTEQEIETGMDDFDLVITLEVIKKLRSGNEHKEGLLLCHALLMRMWKSENISQELQNVSRNWVFLMQSIHGDSFHDNVHDILNDAEQTAALSTYYIYLLNSIWDNALEATPENIPTSVYNTCSEIILKSLELMQQEEDSEIIKIDVLEKLASYYSNSMISRLSNLAIFFMSPTLSRYLTVAEGQKKKSKDQKMPNGGDIIVLLPVHLETMMPSNLDSEFKKWIVLRDDLISYLNEDDAKMIMEKNLDLQADDEASQEETNFLPEQSSFTNSSPIKDSEETNAQPRQMELPEEVTSVPQEKTESKKSKKKKAKVEGWDCPEEGCTKLSPSMWVFSDHMRKRHGWSVKEIRAMRESLGLHSKSVWGEKSSLKKPPRIKKLPKSPKKIGRGRPRKIPPPEETVVKSRPKSPVVSSSVEEEITQMEESAEDVAMSDYLEAMPMQDKVDSIPEESSNDVQTSLLPEEVVNQTQPAIVDKRKFICPICEREFSHRHTVQAHAEFRHHKRPEEAIEIGQNAEEILEEDENGEMEVSNSMVHAKRWYPRVDDFLQEILEEDESTPQLMRNNLSEHIFETVTHMYPHTIPTRLDYKAAADYLEQHWNFKGARTPVQEPAEEFRNCVVTHTPPAENFDEPEATSTFTNFSQEMPFPIEKHDVSDMPSDTNEVSQPTIHVNNYANVSPASQHQTGISSPKSYAVKYSTNYNVNKNKSKKSGKPTYNKVYVKQKRNEGDTTTKKSLKSMQAKTHKGLSFEEALNAPPVTPKTKIKSTKSAESAKTTNNKISKTVKNQRKSLQPKVIPPPSNSKSLQSESQSSTSQIAYSKLMEHAEKNKKKGRKSSHKADDSATDGSETPVVKKPKLDTEYDSTSSTRGTKKSFRKYSKTKPKTGDMSPLTAAEERTDILGEMLDQMNNNNKILMPLDSDEEKMDDDDEKTDNDFICTICDKILTSQFALVCHRRKVHKSKSKVFIPKGMSEKMKIRALNRNYGGRRSSDTPNTRVPKNGKPARTDSSDVLADVPDEPCAQAGKKYKRIKINISKSGNRYQWKDAKDIFGSEGGEGFNCPFEDCNEWFDGHKNICRHFSNIHCASLAYVVDIVIKSEMRCLKNCLKPQPSQEVNNSLTPARQQVKRLAATEAARKISTPEKAKRLWSEYQDLHRLYKKSVRKNVARALVPTSDDSDIEFIDTSLDVNLQVDAKTLLLEEQICARSEFYCWICQPCHQESFSDLSNFCLHVLHKLKNIDQYPFRCSKPGCLYGFRVQKNLRKHQRAHKVEDGFHYLCHFCPSGVISFATPQLLIMHEKRMHTKVQARLSKLRRMYGLDNTDLFGNKINEHFLEFGHRSHHDIWKLESDDVLQDIVDSVVEYIGENVPHSQVIAGDSEGFTQPNSTVLYSDGFHQFAMSKFDGIAEETDLMSYQELLNWQGFVSFDDIEEVSVEDSVQLLMSALIDTIEQGLQVEELVGDDLEHVDFRVVDDEIEELTGTKLYAFWEGKKVVGEIHSPIAEPLCKEDLQMQSITSLTTISPVDQQDEITVPVDDHAESITNLMEKPFDETAKYETNDSSSKCCFVIPIGASDSEYAIQSITHEDLLSYTSATRENQQQLDNEDENRIQEIDDIPKITEVEEGAMITEVEDEEEEVQLVKTKSGRRKREVVQKRPASSDMEVLVNKRLKKSDKQTKKSHHDQIMMQPVVVCRELSKELLNMSDSVSTNTDYIETSEIGVNTTPVQNEDKAVQAKPMIENGLGDTIDIIEKISNFQDLLTLSNQITHVMVVLKSKLDEMRKNGTTVNIAASATKTMSTQTEQSKKSVSTPVSTADSATSPVDLATSKQTTSTALMPYAYKSLAHIKSQLVKQNSTANTTVRPLQIVRPLAKQAIAKEKAVARVVPAVTTTRVATAVTTAQAARANPITALTLARSRIVKSAFQQSAVQRQPTASTDRRPSSQYHRQQLRNNILKNMQREQQQQQSYPSQQQNTSNSTQSYASLHDSRSLQIPLSRISEPVSQGFMVQQSTATSTVTTTATSVPKYTHFIIQNPNQAPQSSNSDRMLERFQNQQYLLKNIMSISENEEEQNEQISPGYVNYEGLSSQDAVPLDGIVSTGIVAAEETVETELRSSPVLGRRGETINYSQSQLNSLLHASNKITAEKQRAEEQEKPHQAIPVVDLQMEFSARPIMTPMTPCVLREPLRTIAEMCWNEEIDKAKPHEYLFMQDDQASMTDLEVYRDVCKSLAKFCKRMKRCSLICKMCKAPAKDFLLYYLHILSHTPKQVLKLVRDYETKLSKQQERRKSMSILKNDLKVVIHPLSVHPEEVFICPDNKYNGGSHQLSQAEVFDKKTCEIFLKAEGGGKNAKKHEGEIACRFEDCKKLIKWNEETREEAMKYFKQHMLSHHMTSAFFNQETPLFHSRVQLQPL